MKQAELVSQTHEIASNGTPAERTRAARLLWLIKWNDPRYLALKAERRSGRLTDDEYFQKLDDLCLWALH